MQAVLKDIPKANRILIKEVDPPKLPSGCLLIKVEAVGICGSDLHAYHWTDDYQKRYSGSLPVILGHEFTGTVESVGEGAEGFTIGQRIVARPGKSCNRCYCCVEGNDGICQNRRIMGVHFDGAMAGYVSVQATNCYALPERCSPVLGAIFEPINVAYNAVRRAGPILGKERRHHRARPVELSHLLIFRFERSQKPDDRRTSKRQAADGKVYGSHPAYRLRGQRIRPL